MSHVIHYDRLGMKSSPLLSVAPWTYDRKGVNLRCMDIGLKFFDGLGPALRRLREKAGLPQTEVAARTGIAQSRLSRYENGRKLPDLTTLGRLLACYGENLVGLHRALEEAQGAAPLPAGHPELMAAVRAALVELGYSQPSPEPKP